MRRRTLTVALSAAVLAVVLLGVPLAVAIWRNALGEERNELERAALRAATAVSPAYRAGDPIELPAASAEIELAVYTPSGRLVAGSGPRRLDDTVRAAATGGDVTDADDAGHIREAVPVNVGERVIGVAVATSDRSDLHATVSHHLVELGGLAAVALLGAGGFAYWQARRLSGPMDALADTATALGQGDFAARPPASGVPEIDRTADELAAAAERISAHLARERAFAAQASHQLRTPLTRLQLELETGLVAGPTALETAARDALDTAEHLSRTIDDVLAVAREQTPSTSAFDVEPLLEQLADHWRGTFAQAGRPLRLNSTAMRAGASESAVRQVLEVLIDNAYRHGRGVLTITVRDSSGAVAVDVADRGDDHVPWPPGKVVDGPMGLAMGRALAEQQGGRLLLDTESVGTRFTLLIPGAEPGPDVSPGT